MKREEKLIVILMMLMMMNKVPMVILPIRILLTGKNRPHRQESPSLNMH